MNIRELINALELFVNDRPGTERDEVVVRGLKGDWLPADVLGMGHGRLYIQEDIGQPYDINMAISAEELRDALPELRKY